MDSVRRNPVSGVLTTLANSPAQGILQATKDGNWLYAADDNSLTVFSVDLESGALTQLQRLDNETDPVTNDPDDGLSFQIMQDVLLNLNETRLLTAGAQLVNGRTFIGGLHSFVRDTPSQCKPMCSH